MGSVRTRLLQGGLEGRYFVDSNQDGESAYYQITDLKTSSKDDDIVRLLAHVKYVYVPESRRKESFRWTHEAKEGMDLPLMELLSDAEATREEVQKAQLEKKYQEHKKAN